ncbi:hypothetical protein Btru_057073 [Bulinus truncatus]|nr:hypothetical protein Btru_057073 [Bulinus truncatus]
MKESLQQRPKLSIKFRPGPGVNTAHSVPRAGCRDPWCEAGEPAVIIAPGKEYVGEADLTGEGKLKNGQAGFKCREKSGALCGCSGRDKDEDQPSLGRDRNFYTTRGETVEGMEENVQVTVAECDNRTITGKGINCFNDSGECGSRITI